MIHYRIGNSVICYIIAILIIDHMNICSANITNKNPLLSKIEFVTIDCQNNIPNTQKKGKVEYIFNISKTEITNAQYSKFLNSIARFHDDKDLYSPLMAEHFFGGIIQEKNGSFYVYYCKKKYENLPVTFVSWFDAIRFINWLHFGMPNLGYATLGTTEGTKTLGAYNTQFFPDKQSTKRQTSLPPVIRNSQAQYWLPNIDEWIKAGFYFENDTQKGYYKYATQSNQQPISAPPTHKKNTANYYNNSWAAPYPHLTPVGSYPKSQSYFGTLDQAGNVMEWIETSSHPKSISRMALGGSLFMYDYCLPITYQDGELPEKKLSTFGFRVAMRKNAKPLPVNSFAFQKESENILGSNTENLHRNDPDEMEFVTIRKPGNKSDPLTNFGHVNYIYEISKYELTNYQYVQFLNSVAKKGDPFELYNLNMEKGALGGIVRSKKNDLYHYKTKNGWENRPVNYISWYDLARLANFYHYGKPNNGESIIGTTEGTDVMGAYDTRFFPSNAEEIKKVELLSKRNEGALFWIPNENEWYKAAYHDPTKPGRKYWEYPVKTDNYPNNLPPPGNIFSINYQHEMSLAQGNPYFLSEVNAYPYAVSYWGTIGQGGNVWEWIEDWRNTKKSNPYRHSWRNEENVKVARGGSFGYIWRGLHSGNRDPANPGHETYVHGGRLAKAAYSIGWSTEKYSIMRIFKRNISKIDKKSVLCIGFFWGVAFSGLVLVLYIKQKKGDL